MWEIFLQGHILSRGGRFSYIILPYSNKPSAITKSLSWVLVRCSFTYFSSFFLQFPHPQFQPKKFRLRMCPTPERQCPQRDRLLILGGIESQYISHLSPRVPNNKHQRISVSPDVPSICCSPSRGVGSIWVNLSVMHLITGVLIK
jgi:hypothetical protein